VGAARVDHEVELFAELDQPVDQQFCPLQMNVVVAWAVDDQQISAQAFGKPAPSRRLTIRPGDSTDLHPSTFEPPKRPN
jgi:hypothetical protein